MDVAQPSINTRIVVSTMDLNHATLPSRVDHGRWPGTVRHTSKAAGEALSETRTGIAILNNHRNEEDKDGNEEERLPARLRS